MNGLLKVCLAGGILMGGSAFGASISLFNTGVDSTGTPLINGAPETHYILLPGSVEVDPLRAANSSNGFPIGPWLGDDALSDWIGPATDANLDAAAGNYTYRTTFDLTGLDPSTASIIGQWSMDDSPVDIFINGVAIGATSAPSGFTGWAPFNINSGFVSGINTLDFEINNGAGPTGLRVEMTGTASLASGTPEPASMLLFGAGLVSLGVIGRRRSRA